MKKPLLAGLLSIATFAMLHAGLNPGDIAVGFTLKNVDDREVSLSDYLDQKGVIVVFTCNPCPFANAYEQRIIQLHTKYADQGFPVLAINSNDESLSPEDSMDKMKIRARRKGIPLPLSERRCRKFSGPMVPLAHHISSSWKRRERNSRLPTSVPLMTMP